MTGDCVSIVKWRPIAHFPSIGPGTLAIVPVDRKVPVDTIRFGSGGRSPDPNFTPANRSNGRTAPPPHIQSKDATAVKLASGKAMHVPGWLLTGVLASQAACLPAMAALGGDATTVESDRVHMKGQVRVTSAASYTVHEITTGTNTIVREYVSPAGKVFAVSWNGPLLPDLQQTLGTYYNDYQNAASTMHVGQRHLTIDRSDLVVHSNGRIRAFSGHAYVPALLPPNFTIADIQ
jgi:hypothetical protein